MVSKLTMSPDLLGGAADEGYGKVADAFRRNILSGHEVGAAVCVYRDGVKVVDLWGGYRDGTTGAPWREDTLVNVFSTTKGIASLAVAVAVSRGLLSYDAKVSDYWPEFAQAGKGAITVRQLISHQAGLPVVDPPLLLADLSDPVTLSAKLAAQAPAWVPGTRHGYHAVTLGLYESELLRRVDPGGRTLGRFFADEIAGPLGLDFHIGLPRSVDRDRVARIHGWSPAALLLHLQDMPARFVLSLLNPRSLGSRVFSVPQGINGLEDYNQEEVRVVELPATNGTGTARSVAKVYGSAATGGADFGLTPAVFDALTQPITPPGQGSRDVVVRVPTTYGLGYAKPFASGVFGSSDKAFGTPGAGGSFGFADPDTGIGFGYVMNRCGFRLWSDPRELALRQALFRDCLGARQQI